MKTLSQGIEKPFLIFFDLLFRTKEFFCIFAGQLKETLFISPGGNEDPNLFPFQFCQPLLNKRLIWNGLGNQDLWGDELSFPVKLMKERG